MKHNDVPQLDDVQHSHVEHHGSHQLYGPNDSLPCSTGQEGYVTKRTMNSNDEHGLSARLVARLEEIGVSIAAWLHFLAWFVGSPFDYIRRKLGEGWQTVQNRVRLRPSLLVAHLAGDLFVGTGCQYDREHRKYRTPCFVIDLDHKGNHLDLTRRLALEHDLLDRYDRVVAALGQPGHLFRSSDSYGLHLYYFFDRPVDLYSLRTSDGSDGAIVRLLAAQGLRPQQGRLELFPGSAAKGRGPQGRVRLPFGLESRLLDHKTFEPMAGPGAGPNLDQSLRLFEEEDVHILSADALIARGQALGSGVRGFAPSERDARTGRQRNRVFGGLATGHSAEYVERLLAVGLTEAGEVNRAASALAFYFRFELDMDRHQAADALVTWLDSHHNNQSITYNASPARARQEVLGVVTRVFAGAHSPWLPMPGLSEFEATSVLALLGNETEACDTLTGDELHQYKLECFGFETLRLAKQHVVSHIAAVLARTGGDSLDDSRVPQHEIATVWPDRSRPVFIVPSPKVLREGRRRAGQRFLKGVGRDRRPALWRAVKNVGLFTLERAASERAGRWATYRVRLDFGALSASPSRSFHCVESAIVAYVPRCDQRARYGTEYRCRKIRKAAEQSPSNQPADATVRRVEGAIAKALRSAALKEDDRDVA
jgi:hypothetical protein